MNIANISATELPQTLLTQQTFAAPGATENPGSFSTLVAGLIKETSAAEHEVGTQTQQLVTGETNNFHEISLAVAQADISFRYLMEVRDQLVGAYREVMRMQV